MIARTAPDGRTEDGAGRTATIMNRDDRLPPHLAVCGFKGSSQHRWSVG
jgi:hypothetical protein